VHVPSLTDSPTRDTVPPGANCPITVFALLISTKESPRNLGSRGSTRSRGPLNSAGFGLCMSGPTPAATHSARCGLLVRNRSSVSALRSRDIRLVPGDVRQRPHGKDLSLGYLPAPSSTPWFGSRRADRIATLTKNHATTAPARMSGRWKPYSTSTTRFQSPLVTRWM
jgi:hypothetical protein